MILSQFMQSPIGTKFIYKTTGDKVTKESEYTVKVESSSEYVSLYSVSYDSDDYLPVIDVASLDFY